MGIPNQTNYAYVVKLKSKPTHDVWVKIKDILYNTVDGNGAQYNKQRIPDDIVVHSPVVSTGGTDGNEEARWLKFTPTDWNSWKSITIQWQRAPIGICNSGNGWRCTSRYIVLDTYSNDSTYGVSFPETLHFTFTPPDPFRDDAATNLDTDGPTITSIEVDAPDPAAAIWAGQDVTVKTGQPAVLVDKNVRVRVTFSANVKMIQSSHDGYGRPYIVLHMTNRERIWTRKAFLDKISNNNVAEFYYRLDDTDRGTNYWLRIESRSGPTQKISVGMNAIRLRPGTNIVADTTDATPANLMHASTSRAVIPASWWNYIARRDSETPVTSDERLRSLISIQGPVVTEGTDTNASIRIFLDLAANAPFTVDYATEDHTACSGETPYGGRCSATSGKDYTKKNGTVSFAEGDTEKTVEIAIADDMVDEGKEFFFVRLSNVSSSDAAAIAHDGLGVVTITNSDPMPQEWLARFGRTVGTHVTDAVGDRLRGTPGQDSYLRVGGYRVPVRGQAAAPEAGPDTGKPGTEAESSASAVLKGLAGLLGLGPGGGTPGQGGVATDSSWLGRPGPDPRLGQSRTLNFGETFNLRRVLLGSAFRLHLNAADSGGAMPRLTAWGRVAGTQFQGPRRGPGSGRGRAHGHRGHRRRLGPGAGRGGRGPQPGGRRVRHAGHRGPRPRGSGADPDQHPSLPAVCGDRPLGRVGPAGLWLGPIGSGTGQRGDLRAGHHSGDGRGREPGHSAGGSGEWRGAVGHPDGPHDDADEFRRVERGAGNLAASEADAHRLRVILEGSRGITWADGRHLTPTVEVGLRHDWGDAETGFGLEVGGRVQYADPGLGLTVEGAVRGLLAHADSEYQEWGASGTVRLAPGGAGHGLSLTLSPAWGVATSGVEGLWARQTTQDLAPQGPSRGQTQTGRLTMEVGYGMAAFDTGLLTPYAGTVLAGGADRTYRVGMRLHLNTSWTRGLQLNLEGQRQELTGAQPVNQGLRLQVGWGF